MRRFVEVYGDNALVGIAFYFAALFRDVIFNQFRFFPILNIFGPKGTGKTAMALSMSKLFGDLPAGINMTNSTIAAMADHVSHTKNAICHIDEFKNSVEYDKIEFLKGLWDGTGRSRMNMDKDRKKEMTPVDSAIVLTGQEIPTVDIALFSRLLFLTCVKTNYSEEEKLRFNELSTIEREGLTHITNEILTHRKCFVEHYLENYNAAADDAAAFVNKSVIEDRIWRNWIVVIAALRTLKDRMDLPFQYADFIKIATTKMADQNAKVKANNEIANFWELFSYMVTDGQVEEYYDYKIRQVNAIKTNKVNLAGQRLVLYVDMTRVLELYQRISNQSNQKPLPKASLKYYLANSPEYLGTAGCKLRQRSRNLNQPNNIVKMETDIDKGNVEKVATLNCKCYCFDYEQLNLSLKRTYDDIDEVEEKTIPKPAEKINPNDWKIEDDLFF